MPTTPGRPIIPMLILVLACAADGINPTAPLPEAGLAASVQAEGDIPPEFLEPPFISYYTTDAFIGPSDASAGGQMEYFGNYAHQTTTATLRSLSDWIVMATTTGETEETRPFPWFGGLVTDAIVGYWGTCGHFVEGNSTHKAQVKYLGQVIAGTTKYSYASDSQSACGGGGGGPGGGGGGSCYTVTTCWGYHVFDSNGNYQYSYYEGCSTGSTCENEM